MNLVPVEKIAKYTIIEVSHIDKSHIDGGLMIATDVSIGNDIVCINKAIAKDLVRKEKAIKTLDYHGWDVSDKKISSLCEYGVEYSGIILPKSRITSMMMVDSMDEFPNTRQWSSRTRQQAEEICDKELAKIEQEYKDGYPSRFVEMEEKWKIEMAKDKAHEMWNDLPWYKKIFKHEARYRNDMVHALIEEMVPEKFYKRLSDNGLPWEDWVKK